MFPVAYLDCPTGISGDMCLGALVDAGVPLEYIEQQLKKLGIDDEYQLSAESVQRNGQAATKVHVQLLTNSHALLSPSEEHPHGHHHEHSHGHHSHGHFHGDHSHGHHSHEHHSHDPHESEPLSHSPTTHGTSPHDHPPSRHLPEITALIQAAELPPQVEQWSLTIFQNLAKAEGLVHGTSPDAVHFHEVGATDAIVDIVGTCLGFDYLGITQFYWSALPTGGGTIRAAHGNLPVPAPAVLRLFELRQVPIYHNGIDRELVTPTGAAIATTLATQFGPPPAMQLHRIGLGAGSRDLLLPNILRLWLGTESQSFLASHQNAGHPHQASVRLTETPELEPDLHDASQALLHHESIVVLET
ncbi:MAG: LarC family nickel insertion protein, partial [Leptolyngbyaceae bacterium]|nr:LarC family nickel insertion protein [Leptolyngbyaceae bacterium]